MMFWLGVLVGGFAGTCLGLLLAGLLASAARSPLGPPRDNA